MSEINILESNLSTLLKGDKGDTPNISLGEVTILEKDQNPTVTISGTELDRKVNFGLPSSLYPWTVERLSEKLDTAYFNGFLTTFQGTVELLATKEELSGQRADLVANIESVATTLNTKIDNNKSELEGKLDLKVNSAEFTAFIATLPDFDTIATKAWVESQLENIPTGGGVTSWNDLTDKPTLFSGSYNDLTDKPDLSLKTINGQSILGVGNIEIQGGVTSWNDLTDKPSIPRILVNGSSDYTYVDIIYGQMTINGDFRYNSTVNINRYKNGSFVGNVAALSIRAYEYMKAEWEAYTNNHTPTLPDNIVTTDMLPDLSGFATKDEVLTNEDGEVIAYALNDLKQKIENLPSSGVSEERFESAEKATNMALVEIYGKFKEVDSNVQNKINEFSSQVDSKLNQKASNEHVNDLEKTIANVFSDIYDKIGDIDTLLDQI